MKKAAINTVLFSLIFAIAPLCAMENDNLKSMSLVQSKSTKQQVDQLVFCFPSNTYYKAVNSAIEVNNKQANFDNGSRQKTASPIKLLTLHQSKTAIPKEILNAYNKDHVELMEANTGAIASTIFNSMWATINPESYLFPLRCAVHNTYLACESAKINGAAIHFGGAIGKLGFYDDVYVANSTILNRNNTFSQAIPIIYQVDLDAKSFEFHAEQIKKIFAKSPVVIIVPELKATEKSLETELVKPREQIVENYLGLLQKLLTTEKKDQKIELQKQKLDDKSNNNQPLIQINTPTTQQQNNPTKLDQPKQVEKTDAQTQKDELLRIENERIVNEKKQKELAQKQLEQKQKEDKEAKDKEEKLRKEKEENEKKQKELLEQKALEQKQKEAKDKEAKDKEAKDKEELLRKENERKALEQKQKDELEQKALEQKKKQQEETAKIDQDTERINQNLMSQGEVPETSIKNIEKIMEQQPNYNKIPSSKASTEEADLNDKTLINNNSNKINQKSATISSSRSSTKSSNQTNSGTGTGSETGSEDDSQKTKDNANKNENDDQAKNGETKTENPDVQ